jgi:hypothetical protein
VDFEQNQITVREDKRFKDRVTMLPGGIKARLVEHLKRVKLSHEHDLAAGQGRVYLPYALSQKYPAADREWGWNRGSTIAWTGTPFLHFHRYAALPDARAVPRLEPARRPADAPPALTGGLGNPGPSVQSRNCPRLLLDWGSRRSGRFVVAGAARVAGVLLGKRSGSGPGGVRGGSRKALCLQGVSAAFRLRRSLGCGC